METLGQEWVCIVFLSEEDICISMLQIVNL